MSTLGEQARVVQDDHVRQHTRRLRVIIDYRENGHKIQHIQGQWITIEPGHDLDKAIHFALEQTLEKGFTR
jgi:hypothetical protein